MSHPETTQVPEPWLRSAPASVQTVLRELTGHAPMTGKELREATGLPRRTIYTALSKLRQLGILEERSSLKDTRQTYFWVPSQRVPAAAPPSGMPDQAAATSA